MIGTKEKICSVARRLFNERGYASVSLRDIADASDTTLGNLTYHFHHKLDLLNAILEGPHSVHWTIFKSANITEQNALSEITQRFLEIQRNEIDAIYYFRNMIELRNSYQSISEKQFSYRKDMYGYFKIAFEILFQSDLSRGNVPEGTAEVLAELVVFTISLWYQKGSPTMDNSMPVHSLFDALSVLLLPYLSDKGRVEFLKVCGASE